MRHERLLPSAIVGGIVFPDESISLEPDYFLVQPGVAVLIPAWRAELVSKMVTAVIRPL
jgi:hypothetical protein